MLKEVVQKQMVEAMKEGNKEKKTSLSVLSAALKNKEIEKRSELTEQEEVEVVAKMVKQVNESLETAPADRVEIIEKLKRELEVYKQFMPEQMTEEKIKETIEVVLDKLGLLGNATPKNKGAIMKELMPLVKGKADGKLVNTLLGEYLKIKNK